MLGVEAIYLILSKKLVSDDGLLIRRLIQKCFR